MERRKTIKKEITFKGKGLDSGEDITLILYPCDKEGIFFKFDKKLINLKEIQFTSEKRGTCLLVGDNRIYYVEHLLSALNGTGVDDVIIEVKGREIPFFDGSSRFFAEKILEVGLEEKDKVINYYKILKPFTVSFNNSFIKVLPSDNFIITYRFTKEPFKKFSYTYTFSPESYVKEIAPSKTFITYEEAMEAKKRGLFKGGDEKLALIFKDGEILNKESKTFDDEPARHKILDVMGDLYLLSRRFKGEFIFEGTGHRDHIYFLKILEAYSGYGRSFDIEKIRKIMPHDYPFLFVDRILSLEDDRIVALKNVTFNEPFFEGHFPETRVMPGVLIVEAMAQAGGFLLLDKIKEKENKLLLFSGIDDVKFKSPLYPGDTVYFVLKLLRFRGRVCKMEGFAVKEDKIVCSAIMTAAIVDKNEGE
jgi:UDP-3-O-[3-hydroxymyristoyl] N-acetylglucosamine deacetylase/3-hydroxyacyl-[acyl-carrier-protein] dehydratase